MLLVGCCLGLYDCMNVRMPFPQLGRVLFNLQLIYNEQTWNPKNPKALLHALDDKSGAALPKS